MIWIVDSESFYKSKICFQRSKDRCIAITFGKRHNLLPSPEVVPFTEGNGKAMRLDSESSYKSKICFQRIHSHSLPLPSVKGTTFCRRQRDATAIPSAKAKAKAKVRGWPFLSSTSSYTNLTSLQNKVS